MFLRSNNEQPEKDIRTTPFTTAQKENKNLGKSLCKEVDNFNTDSYKVHKGKTVRHRSTCL